MTWGELVCWLKSLDIAQRSLDIVAAEKVPGSQRKKKNLYCICIHISAFMKPDTSNIPVYICSQVPGSQLISIEMSLWCIRVHVYICVSIRMIVSTSVMLRVLRCQGRSSSKCHLQSWSWICK